MIIAVRAEHESFIKIHHTIYKHQSTPQVYIEKYRMPMHQEADDNLQTPPNAFFPLHLRFPSVPPPATDHDFGEKRFCLYNE